MDPNFGIPRPPINSPIPTTNIIIEQAVMYTSGLIGVALGTIDAYRTKTLLPLLLPISGAFIAFPELMLDVLGGGKSCHGFTYGLAMEPLCKSFSACSTTTPLPRIYGFSGV